MSLMDAIFANATNNVKSQLEENGQIGSVKTEKTTIFPETEIDLALSEGVYLYLEKFDYDLGIKPGDTLKVIFDGISYDVNAILIGTGNNSYSIAAGNLSLYGGMGEDTKEPFCLVYTYQTFSSSDDVNAPFGVVGTSESSHTIAVYKDVETIHPIDKKYIPALDSLTLNGADGKQYSVTVDANGALAVTAVE